MRRLIRVREKWAQLTDNLLSSLESQNKFLFTLEWKLFNYERFVATGNLRISRPSAREKQASSLTKSRTDRSIAKQNDSLNTKAGTLLGAFRHKAATLIPSTIQVNSKMHKHARQNDNFNGVHRIQTSRILDKSNLIYCYTIHLHTSLTLIYAFRSYLWIFDAKILFNHFASTMLSFYFITSIIICRMQMWIHFN